MLRICPSCKKPLALRLAGEGAIWVCDACGGRVLPLSALRRAGAPVESIRDIWHQARRAEGGAGRPCPHCRRAMSAVLLPTGGEKITLDVCVPCQTVWFDPRELEAAVAPRGKPASPPDAEGLRPPGEVWRAALAVLGMPVELDAPPLRRKPRVTQSLAAAMILTAFFTFDRLGATVQEWGFLPAEWSRHGGWTLATSFFLHGGWLHLLSNLYFLLVFGDNVEDRLGRFRYLLLVAASHGAGMLAQMGVAADALKPCVGASAGISGIVAYYALAYPHVRLGFRAFWYFFFTRWLVIPASAALVIFVAVQLIGVGFQAGGFGGIAYAAHLGGLAVGVIAGVAALRRRMGRAPTTAEGDRYTQTGERRYAR